MQLLHSERSIPKGVHAEKFGVEVLIWPFMAVDTLVSFLIAGMKADAGS